jgi:hypothetical protein
VRVLVSFFGGDVFLWSAKRDTDCPSITKKDITLSHSSKEGHVFKEGHSDTQGMSFSGKRLNEELTMNAHAPRSFPLPIGREQAVEARRRGGSTNNARGSAEGIERDDDERPRCGPGLRRR